MKEIIQENIALILTTIFGGGSFYGWLFERKKRKAETRITEAESKSKDLDNQDKENNIYKAMLDDLSFRYEKRYNELDSLYESKCKQLEDQIRYQKQVINNLKKEITELNKKIKEQK